MSWGKFVASQTVDLQLARQSTKVYKKRRGFCRKKIDKVVNVNKESAAVYCESPDVYNNLNFDNSAPVNNETHEINIDNSANRSTASDKKVEPILASTPYRIVDMEVLSSVFDVLACPSFVGRINLKLSEIASMKKGLAPFLFLQCHG